MLYLSFKKRKQKSLNILRGYASLFIKDCDNKWYPIKMKMEYTYYKVGLFNYILESKCAGWSISIKKFKENSRKYAVEYNNYTIERKNINSVKEIVDSASMYGINGRGYELGFNNGDKMIVLVNNKYSMEFINYFNRKNIDEIAV